MSEIDLSWIDLLAWTDNLTSVGEKCNDAVYISERYAKVALSISG
jgi:hypothetical protein